MRIRSFFSKHAVPLLAMILLATQQSTARAALSDTGALPWRPATFGDAILATIVFGLIGIGLAIVGFKLFDLATPFDLQKEICEDKNLATAILCAAFVLGICWIIAAAVS